MLTERFLGMGFHCRNGSDDSSFGVVYEVFIVDYPWGGMTFMFLYLYILFVKGQGVLHHKPSSGDYDVNSGFYGG
jgi:hypothetical protein